MQPIFIAGCERSGTTLLGAMLGSNPQAICIPEAQFILDLLPQAAPDVPTNFHNCISQIKNHLRFKHWNFNIDNAETPKESHMRFSQIISWLILQYAREHNKENPDFWIEHTPKKVKFLDRLLRHFPDAKTIHLVRDGRAVAASVLPLVWGPNDIQEAAHFWVERLAFGYSAGAMLESNRLIHIRYEDVVLDSERTIKQIADWAGMKYTPLMLGSTGFSVPNYTRKQHSLVGTPPDKKRLDAWQTNLSSRQIEIFEGLVGDLLVYNGYPLLAKSYAPPTSIIETTLIIQHRIWRRMINSVIYRSRKKRYAK